ncbi:2-hydroxyacyl-CoA dehydratase family protein [Clostridium sporogenes]|uniref:2-hydroxyacyl-CoA dehydratase n=1 Tax=Clostridium botulinum TaxID=1491 RepID=A0A6M0T2E4_CLOBO|nr:double-cubane-cluster-containing anaerobic reductase [Clostridium sporogenes]NFA61523.1 2-hydroxyacyl-CoA dehydratase [Clostridium botulinum]NFI74564.1 2-hydroxyacyl-CoA dehydratase [Clostridium sporogenes]NFL71931.1 2-hydroxyacyl-CoA dehydratase [Clostridium sporogenes]NFM24053.1 2-hydroxyacyl-CoA dehydratase [Clostridium sporogenes]NFP62574.1 2-hydroxyacyl-CoA dehydratase [Clostridium sporogenes]
MNKLPEFIKDFSEARRNAFVKMKEIKDEGGKIVGVYCGFAPWEVIAASGAVAAWLCGMDEEPIEDAEKYLPRNLCPLIKSSYGFAITEKCPFYYFSDMLLGETTCDGKKKMYELLSEMKPMYVMNIPQTPYGQDSYDYYKKAIIKLKEELEKNLKVEITEEKLKETIKLRNRERMALRDYYSLSKLCPPPMTGYNLRRVIQGTLYLSDKEKEIEDINNIIRETMKKYNEGERPVSKEDKRILVTGCPLGDSTEKVIEAIENNGGVVVCYENCSGAKDESLLVDEEKDAVDALTERYLRTACACMSPNDNRIEYLDYLIDEYEVEGVVEVILQACHTYNVESDRIKIFVKNNKKMPYLKIETDYSKKDLGQLKTRVEAFIEML